MNLDSSLFYVVVSVSAIILAVVLVALLYKPGKRLKVVANYAGKDGWNKNAIEFHISNIGKNRVKMATPFVKFYSTQHSVLYEVKRKYTSCKFPKIIAVGEEMHCKFDVGHFYESIDKLDFKPHHVKIVIRDTVAMKFYSNSLDYKH